MKQNKLTVCYFGIYNPDYSRNRVLIKGLKQNDVQVIECNQRGGRWKYIKLFFKHWQIRNNYDFMIVGFPGQSVIWLAKLISKKPIIFDAFASIYDSMIEDRKLIKPKSLKALYYWFLDWLSCRLAAKILLDTEAHINYFIKQFHLKKNKFEKIFVGSDDEIMRPMDKKLNRNYFLVHFHGNFIPLQGIEYIIKAAKILDKDNVKFNIVGKGQEYKKIMELVKEFEISNINFIDPVPYEELKDYIAEADICLGIFGNTAKAKRVIPNKVYEYLAVSKPVITGDSPAAREILEDRKHCLFCRLTDADDLAKKISELKNNPDLADQITKNGHQLFKDFFSPKVLGERLVKIIKDIKI